MYWNNILEFRCPKCNSSLKISPDKGMRICSNRLCDFKMRSSKLKQIQEDIKNKQTNEE